MSDHSPARFRGAIIVIFILSLVLPLGAIPTMCAQAPASAVTVPGNGSNIIYINREHDLVVVRWIRQSAFNEFIGQVLSAVGTQGQG